MDNETRIVQPCPSCKRKLHIRASYVGQTVQCKHCRQQFLVRDPSSSQLILSDSGLALLNRVDEVLEQAQHQTRIKDQ